MSAGGRVSVSPVPKQVIPNGNTSEVMPAESCIRMPSPNATVFVRGTSGGGLATIGYWRMATFHLLNFGCRASQADGAALKRQLLEAGFEEAATPEQSGVTVLNTCTVTASADAEVRQMVRRIHRANPNCRILVTGCYAQRAPSEIAHLEGVAWVVGNSHKHRAVDILKTGSGAGAVGPCVGKAQVVPAAPLVQIRSARAGSDNHQEPVAPRAEVLVGEISEEFHFAPVFSDDRTRPTLKVQDGCNARCSFCIIPEVRGPSRSLAPAVVIEQICELESAGYKEVVLSGINLGSYGKDLYPRVNFLGLLERILRETFIARVRISSIEPMDVTSELVGLVAGETRLARHFHVPLQSGCDRMLRLMKRRYWAAQYAERISAIRELIPDCGIGADVMLGFPGETDEDHSRSLRFIESLPFSYLHIFPFSARPGTAAAGMPGRVDPRTVRARGQEIRTVIAEKRGAFLTRQLGSALSVLTLSDTEEHDSVALSSNFLKVILPGCNVPVNRLLEARVGRVVNGVLYGYPELARGVVGSKT